MMSVATFDPSQSVTMTDSAIAHIEQEIAATPETPVFRVFLRTSGCSGFMYETELVSDIPEGDQEFNVSGSVRLSIPQKDLPHLNGTVIDYATMGLNSLLKFINPNVTAECGCGESFTVDEDQA